jgi:hypothetical protein
VAQGQVVVFYYPTHLLYFWLDPKGTKRSRHKLTSPRRATAPSICAGLPARIRWKWRKLTRLSNKCFVSVTARRPRRSSLLLYGIVKRSLRRGERFRQLRCWVTAPRDDEKNRHTRRNDEAVSFCTGSSRDRFGAGNVFANYTERFPLLAMTEKFVNRESSLLLYVVIKGSLWHLWE